MRSDVTVSPAEQFVDLLLSPKWPEDVPESRAIEVFSSVVSAAGFDSPVLVRGQMKSRYRDTAEEYTVNTACPFFVEIEGRQDRSATGWLNQLVLLVHDGKSLRTDRYGLVVMVEGEIENSRPLEPVQITPQGDVLEETPPFSPMFFLVKHSRDGDELSRGMHGLCRGHVERIPSTAMEDVLHCARCSLRVRIPREVETYGELRRLMEDRFRAD